MSDIQTAYSFYNQQNFKEARSLFAFFIRKSIDSSAKLLNLVKDCDEKILFSKVKSKNGEKLIKLFDNLKSIDRKKEFLPDFSNIDLSVEIEVPKRKIENKKADKLKQILIKLQNKTKSGFFKAQFDDLILDILVTIIEKKEESNNSLKEKRLNLFLNSIKNAVRTDHYKAAFNDIILDIEATFITKIESGIKENKKILLLKEKLKNIKSARRNLSIIKNYSEIEPIDITFISERKVYKKLSNKDILEKLLQNIAKYKAEKGGAYVSRKI